MTGPLWISEQEVVSLMSLPQAIEALRGGLREEATGRAINMIKTHAVWGSGSTLHAVGAVLEDRAIVGTKTWAHTERGAMPLLILIDGNDGSVLAIIEAFALGQMRTGGISGVATDLMAPRDASRMAMIGAGKQSLAQIAAVAAVRTLRNITIWSPTVEKREALAERTARLLSISTVAARTLDEALDGAEIVTVATRAKVPFLKADALKDGVHLNAVGAITPERAEFEPSLLDRAGVITADSVAQVRNLSREFIDAFGDDELAWSRVLPLSGLLLGDGERPVRPGITVFKAMGMGLSDLSLGAVLLESAKKAGLGRVLPRPGRADVRLVESIDPKEKL